jgi:ribonuclease BN (tRNA processing enzyme)
MIMTVIIGVLLFSSAYAATCGKVTTVGTGQAMPLRGRAGPCTVISYGDETNDCSAHFLVFDLGLGSVKRIVDHISPKLANVDAFFMSHVHSDHSIDFPSLAYYNWLAAYPPTSASLYVGFNVYVPNGLSNDYVRKALDALNAEVNLRNPPKKLKLNIFNYTAPINPEIIYTNTEVTVWAVSVTHFSEISVSWFIDIHGVGSIVISGDINNAGTQNIIKLANIGDIDIMVHELMHSSFSTNGAVHSQASNVVDRALLMGIQKLMITHMLPTPYYPYLGTIPSTVPYLSYDDYSYILEVAGLNQSMIEICDDMSSTYLPSLDTFHQCLSRDFHDPAPTNYQPLRSGGGGGKWKMNCVMGGNIE